MTPHTFVGVDGCKAGWVAVTLDPNTIRADVYRKFEDLLTAAREAAVIAVDIPIGLLPTGKRSCDQAVRDFLGPRRSSLFPMPPRPVLDAPTFEEACRISFEATGKKISKQTYALRNKIFEVDRHRADLRIIEVHPATSFDLMAGR